MAHVHTTTCTFPCDCHGWRFLRTPAHLKHAVRLSTIGGKHAFPPGDHYTHGVVELREFSGVMASLGRVTVPIRQCLRGLRATRLARPMGTNTGSPVKFPGISIPKEKAHEYEVRGDAQGVASTVRTGTGHAVSTDVLPHHGGGNAAPQPVELLIAALIGCEGATTTFVARHMRPRFPVSRVEFDYRAVRDSRGSMHLPLDAEKPVTAQLQRISGTATVHLKPGASETAERVEELRRHVEQRCPVATMVHASGCAVDVQWRLHSDEP